jgi:hypothetical protein
LDLLARPARVLHEVLLGLWLGAGALYVSLWTQLDRLLGARGAAGAVLLAARESIDAFGLIAGPLLLVTLVLGWAPLKSPLRWRALGTMFLGGAAVFSWLRVVPRATELAAAMPAPLEQLPPARPEVLEYLELLTLASELTMAQTLVALVLLILGVISTGERTRQGIQL